MTESLLSSTIVGMLVGIALGFLPLVVGSKRNQMGLAITGFFTCIITSAIGGLILGAPCAALFWWVIKKSENRSKEFKD